MKKKQIEKKFKDGVFQINKGFYKEAIASFSECISLGHKVPEVYSNRGVAYNDLGLYEDAIKNYQKAIQINPNYVEAYCNLGVTLNSLKRFKDASVELKKAIRLKPSFATAHINLGISFQNLSMLHEALEEYGIALALDPNNALAYKERGITFASLKKYHEAFDSYDKAINLNPNFVDAYINAGITFMTVKNPSEALGLYEEAIKIDPGIAKPYKLKANALYELKKYEESIDCLNQALKIDRNLEGALGEFLLKKNTIFDWQDFYKLSEEIKDKIKNNIRVSDTFACLSFFDDPAVLKKSALLESSSHVREDAPKKYLGHSKIRLGFFSSDFKNHPIAQLTSEFFETINRSQFEVIAFSFGATSKDDLYRIRLEKAFDKFIDVKDINDLNIVKLSRELEIDIAIDLNGMTADCRTDLFARRLAPIQIQWLGFLGTMGAPFIDYIFADRNIIPESEIEHYSEKIVYLPHYQPNDSKREISNKHFVRSDFGLSDDHFVFCCFNNAYKIKPFIFDSWMNILKESPNGVLWLAEEKVIAQANIKNEALARDVDPSRIIFAQKIPLAEYLLRFKLADLFLDTFPYSAGTVASDALRMGLPLMALQGKTFSSRMSSSLLHSINMPELIAHSSEEYESIAINLCKDKNYYQKIKIKLENELRHSALFNIKRTTRSIEEAFKLIYDRSSNDKPIEHIFFDD